jgi:hypothetical protein
MAARGEMRNWAKRDRTIVPPQRAYARSMRANPTDAEVDGGQHAERVSADVERTGVFEANGYRVLRSWNNDVLANINGVLVDIHNSDPHP